MVDTTAGGQVRILFVSDERAWPPVTGYRHRTRLILSTLGSIGSVTWVAALRNRFDDGEPLEVPDALRSRIEPHLVSAGTRSRFDTLRRWSTTGLPWPLAAGDWSAADRRLAELATPGFDLVWAMGLDALAATRRAGIEAPVRLVDADLESLKLARHLEQDAGGSPIRTLLSRSDVGRWARLERAAADELSGFSVCSDQERRRLGGSAFVTANAYPAMPRLATADPGDRSPSPVLLFVGSMGYEPNRDGLAWFIEEVLPLVRNRRPGVELRVVGSGPAVDPALARMPGVDVVGRVDEIGPELGRAGAVVVPIRWGAGTRIKIIEAMANRVPVVSTTVGAEGLGLADGVHLLIADDPESFAAACVRVLAGGPDVADLVDQAARRFERDFAEPVVSHRLEERVRALLAAGRDRDGR